MKTILLTLILSVAWGFGAFIDDEYTIGLWHMDYGDGVILADANTERSNNLQIYGCSSTASPTGNAIHFENYQTDYINSNVDGSLTTPWKGLDNDLESIKIETSFRVDQKKTGWLVGLGGWDGAALYVDGSAVKFFYKLNDGTSNTLTVWGVPDTNENPTENTWLTATAIVNPYTGVASVEIDGWVNDIATANLTTGQTLAVGNFQLEIGGQNTYGGNPHSSRGFVGAIDNVKVSTFDTIEWQIDYNKPLNDNKYTKLLLHMEEFVESTWIADDDSANPGRDANLQTIFCELVESRNGLGKAINFNGTSSFSQVGGFTGTDWRNFPWKAYPSIKIETWVYVKKSGTQWIAQVGDWTATLFAEGSSIRFNYKMDNEVNEQLLVWVVVDSPKWLHIVAEFNHFTGKASLKVTGDASAYAENDVSGRMLYQGFGRVKVGADANGTTRQLEGLVDELRISVPQNSSYETNNWMTIYEDSQDTKGLWHFDEELIDESTRTTPDDDSFAGNRDNPLVLYDGDTIAAANTGPEFITNDPNRTTAYLFDGISANMKASGVNFSPSNLRVEAWVKFNGLSTGTYPIIWQENSFLLMIEDGDVYWVGFDKGGFKISYAPYDDSKWHHLAGEYLNGVFKLFIDGKYVYANSERAKGIELDNPGGDLYVGKFVNVGGDHFWNGMIDEVRISQAYPEFGCGSWGYLPADINKDCIVDINDLVLFSASWLQDSELIDLTKDEFVNNDDYSILADTWLECTDPDGSDCINLH